MGACANILNRIHQAPSMTTINHHTVLVDSNRTKKKENKCMMEVPATVKTKTFEGRSWHCVVEDSRLLEKE